jgi:hypothetical protein
MKYILALIIGLVLLSTGVHATNSNSVAYTTDVLSKYIDTDGQVYHTKPVIQSELVFSLNRGLYISIWHSAGLDFKSSLANELKYSLGWSGEGLMDFDVGIAYDDLNQLFQGPKNDVLVSYIKVGKTLDFGIFGKFKPMIELTSYETNKHSDFEGGFRASSSLECVFSRGSIDYIYTPTLLKDNGTFGAKPAWVMSHEFAAVHKIGNLSLKLPSVSIYTPLSSHSNRKTSVVVGVGTAGNF